MNGKQLKVEVSKWIDENVPADDEIDSLEDVASDLQDFVETLSEAEAEEEGK